MTMYFERLQDLEAKVGLPLPSEQDTRDIITAIGGDEQLRRAFYDKATVAWLDLLSENGVFGRTPEPKDEGDGKVSFPWWAEGEYLKRVSSKKPNEVLAIIRRIKTENPRVAGCCIECLLAMPTDVAIQGDEHVIGFLESQHKTIQFYDWSWIGGPSAKYMVKIAGADFGKALAIAHRLLEIHPTTEGWEKVQSRYHKHEYLELMRLVQQLWEINPADTLRAMVQVLDRFLCEIKNTDPNLFHMGFKYSIDDLENPSEDSIHAQDIEVTLIQGICQAGRAVIDKQTDLISTMLEDIEKRDKPIFLRIMLYLMRYVGTGKESERLNRLVADPRFAIEDIYKNELHKMIMERWSDIGFEARERYLQNIADFTAKKTKDLISGKTWDERKYGESEARETTARWAAIKLYDLRDCYRRAFDQYLKEAGVDNEEQVKPMPLVSGKMEWVDPAGGAEYSEEEWLKWEPVKVIEICGDTTKKWKRTDKWGGVEPGEGTQASVLERVVKKQPAEYVGIEAVKVAAMRPAFLAAYFRAIWETIRQGGAELDWDGVTEICSKTVALHHDNTSYRSALNGVCDVLKEMIDRDALRNDVIAGQIERFWAIVDPLTRFPVNPEETDETDEDKDPVQAGINCVPGEAAQLTIRLGVIQRNRSQETYEQSSRTRIQNLLQWILDSVRVAKVECMIGRWLPQLFYIEEQWMTEHLDDLFDDENPRRWWAIWETYVVWSRVSPTSFAILKNAGIYASAVQKIGEKPSSRYRESAEVDMMKHLMIAYFNGWMEYDDPLMGLFFEKADAKLRGQAAEFLTTGFKSFKEDVETESEKKKIAIGRLSRYWTERLKAGKENPEEMIGFSKWAKDTVLEKGETLELLRQTLELTEGKTGEWGRRLTDCVEGICEIGEGRELIALECLLLLAQNRDIVMKYFLVKEPLRGFFDGVVGLGGNYPEIREIRKKAMEFADRLGRMGELDLREIWKELKAKQGG
jgi:hypothetical protein